ncbi:carbon-nitrogen hydrolase family protein [Amphritea balenae]|uniref:Carbon-nitrogen hydrolase family protein n=1 Tax=Amphritea balenae TaxID=452629 RepID=A0A3P1SQ20_9GAMM|nr:carbon-nitrogen hydrolase family protein [Amphritea balenae]RRC99351.1 carbon-nitrogen hydrolase family protein [Amphritea balenae]GGK71838.1 carbon-nitrogen hydrolase family protein [Amphritea balenae]
MNNSDVIIALVQYQAVKGRIDHNLKKHLEHVALAAESGADVVVFPELSLTGYEPELASDLAIKIDADPVMLLSEAAKKKGVIVISGCPLKSDETRPYIGALISYPSGKTDLYRKQHLHPGESDHFITGTENYDISHKGQQIALAICADFCDRDHAAKAKAAGADAYLCSVLISENGFAVDSQLLQSRALENGFPVLMANYSGETGGWVSCGKSRVWGSDGEVVVASGSSETELVLCTVSKGKVGGKVLSI